MDVEYYADEIQQVKDHVEIVYQYVNDHVNDSALLYKLPDENDLQNVFCQLYKSIHNQINAKLVINPISDEISFHDINKVKLQKGKESFVDFQLSDIFSKWDINVIYMSNTFEDVMSWDETNEI